ncbi:MAG: helix-turn-helix domain-containing protein [Candidatus Pacebacteria bacterium]|nr:helix-turn-helix domain-containing protein [Candidatus Paceibacterota bacterium]
MDITQKFGKRVRALRLKKNMSQGDLGKILDVHSTYISKIERGEQNISIQGVEKLAKAIGVSVGELMK